MKHSLKMANVSDGELLSEPNVAALVREWGRDEQERMQAIERLRAVGVVTCNDLADAHRYLKYDVCDQLWDMCDGDVKTSLLNDRHPHIRSTAEMAVILSHRQGDPRETGHGGVTLNATSRRLS